MEGKYLGIKVVHTRYLSVYGTLVDDIGKKGIPFFMPDEYHQNRVRRDGTEHYHITFANHVELSRLMNAKGIDKKGRTEYLDNMVKALINTFGDPAGWEPPVDLGLGRLEQQVQTVTKTTTDETKSTKKKQTKQKKQKAKKPLKRKNVENEDIGDDGVKQEEANDERTQQETVTTAEVTEKTVLMSQRHVSYYRVIYWPFGQKLRNYFGLPATPFHITLGFDPKDIHSHKGPDTLLLDDLQRDDPLLKRLAECAVDYPEETLFLTRLFNCLIQWNMKELAEPWMHHLPVENTNR